ncbi:hypothetical protein D3C85_1504990 [compost metagenome]
MVDGTDAGQQQGGNLGLLELGDDGAQVFLVAMCREAIVHRSAAEAITMGDFDQRNAGSVEAGSDLHHFLEGDLVALGVHAVAQRHVVQFDLLAA